MSSIMTRNRSTLKLSIAAAALVVAGGAAGAIAIAETRPSVTMAPATPVAIRSLSSEGIVTVRGRVAEVYGNKFVMADASGRALVDAGPGGKDGLVKANDPVTVQGRFDDGIIQAAFLVTSDGKVTALGPLDGPRHHGKGPHGRDDGPDGGPDGDRRDGPPPPPPPAPVQVAPAQAAPAGTTAG